MRENSRKQFWILSFVLIVIASSMLWCGSLDAPVRAQNPPAQTLPAGTMLSYMIKWAPFEVSPGTEGQFLLATHNFGGPILLDGLEIHAHPDTGTDALSEIYVVQGEQDPSSAPDMVLGYGASWTRSDPFRSEVLMFPKPIPISSGTITVWGFMQDLSTVSTQHETGEVFVYYEPAN